MKTFLFLLLCFAQNSFAAEKTFRVRLAEDLGTVDWNYGEINPEVIYQLMEGLFTTDQVGKPVPAAVQSFSWNPEKTELKIKLKKNQWSDGEPLCGKHFVDSWNRLLSKEFASPYAHYAHGLKSFSSDSCDSLKVAFVRPSPEALAYFSHFVFFPIRLDQVNADKKIFSGGSNLIVNGPFQIRSWQLNKLLVLERNPKYSGAKPFLDKIEFLFLAEDSTAKIMYEKGELDWLRDVPALLRNEALEKNPEFHVFPSFTTYYYGLNAGKSKLLEDAEIRWALSEALNRQEIAKVLGKENRGVQQWLAKEIYPKLKPSPKKKFSLAIASEKLKAALAGQKMDILLRVYNKSAHKLFAEWAQGQWEKKLGVRIPIEVQEGKVYWKEINTNPGAIHISGITAPFGHPRAYFQEFLSTSTANWTGWKSEAYDLAVNKEEFQKAEDILADAGVVIPLYTRDTVALVQKKWKGFFINPLGQAFLSKIR